MCTLRMLTLALVIPAIVPRCREKGVRPTPVSDETPRASGIEHIVSAGGYLVAPIGNRFTLALSAQSYDDGIAKGQLQVQVHSFSSAAHGRIDCLNVQGDTAWVSGTFTHSPDSEWLVGGSFLLGVRDGGIGPSAEVDKRTSLVSRSPASPPLSCYEPWPLTFIPWNGGNVLIK